MPDTVKAKIAERNGVELEFTEEYALIPENFPFSDPDFAADNTKDAILEAKETAEVFGLVESFSSDATESTTSNNWIVKSGFPYTTTAKEAGDYLIDYTAQITQTQKQKAAGFNVQWREGTTGSWTDLADIREGVSVDNGYSFRTSFNRVTLASDGVFQVRVRYGQTDDGGTMFIRFVSIKITKAG